MERCPYLRVIRAGDESFDWCDLSDNPCLLITGDECEEYEDFLKEIAPQNNGGS